MAMTLSGTWRCYATSPFSKRLKECDALTSLSQAGQYEAAWRLAVEFESRLNEVAYLTNDNQLLEDANLMRRYQQTLADALVASRRSPASPG